MSSQRFQGGRVALFIFLSCCRLTFAQDASSSAPADVPSPAPGATSQPGTAPENPEPVIGRFGDSSATDTTPSLRALPVETSGNGGIDTSNQRKFYTITAALRETYDDNVNTTPRNPETSLETNISPSILVDFPDASGSFTGRYTFGLTYYGESPGSNKNNNDNQNLIGARNIGSTEMTHDAVAQYAHNFSDRFQLSVAEELRYDVEPNIIQSLGTNYQDGAYLTNVLNANLSAQLSPKLSVLGTFSNSIVRYEDSIVGQEQNSIEDTGSVTGNYAVLPKISASLGTQIDDITYQSGDRGYTSYTLFGGGFWEVLPSLSLTLRGGLSYTEEVNQNAILSPYAAIVLNWTLGSRSSLTFNYSHEITPSSEIGVNGQLSDRFEAAFNYAITPRLTANLRGSYTSATTTGLAINDGQLINGYDEDVYEVNVGMAFNYTSNLSFDWGARFSGVDSQIDDQNYSRDEVYVGVRGTY